MAMRSRDNKNYNHNYGIIRSQAFPNEAFVAQIVPWSDQNLSGILNESRVLITSDSLESLSEEMRVDYNQKAIMSFDGLVRPISMDGAGGFPRYISYNQVDSTTSLFSVTVGSLQIYGEKEYTSNGTREAELPFKHQDDLNPLTNPAGNERSFIATERSTFSGQGAGHDMEIVARTGEGEGGTPDDGLIIPPIKTTQTARDYQADYRFFGLRGPIVLHSWGYDTDGFPVPNEVDTLSGIQQGNFAVSNRTDKFYPGHLKDSRTWATAPVDFCLDRDRGVWTIDHRYWYGKILDKIAETGAITTILLENPDTSGIPWGNSPGNSIRILNDSDQALFRDTRCLLERQSDNGSFKIISTVSDFRIWEGRATENIAPRTRGTVEIFRPQVGNDEVSYQGFEVEALNSWLHESESVEAGDEIRVYIDRGQWKILHSTGSGMSPDEMDVVRYDCTQPLESGYWYGYIQDWNKFCPPCLSGVPDLSGTPDCVGDPSEGSFSDGMQCRIKNLSEWFPV